MSRQRTSYTNLVFDSSTRTSNYTELLGILNCAKFYAYPILQSLGMDVVDLTVAEDIDMQCATENGDLVFDTDDIEDEERVEEIACSSENVLSTSCVV